MEIYVLLFRGINVGGKNKVPMAELKVCLEELGFSNVSTYIASGNALVRSDKDSLEIKKIVEEALPITFSLDSELVKVLVLAESELEQVIAQKPKGFGEKPEVYMSDAIFLIDAEMKQILPIFNPRAGVDMIWEGPRVIYSQRLSVERSKSRLSTIASSPLYKSLTIRNWNTVEKLLSLARNLPNF